MFSCHHLSSLSTNYSITFSRLELFLWIEIEKKRNVCSLKPKLKLAFCLCSFEFFTSFLRCTKRESLDCRYVVFLSLCVAKINILIYSRFNGKSNVMRVPAQWFQSGDIICYNNGNYCRHSAQIRINCFCCVTLERVSAVFIGKVGMWHFTTAGWMCLCSLIKRF